MKTKVIIVLFIALWLKVSFNVYSQTGSMSIDYAGPNSQTLPDFGKGLPKNGTISINIDHINNDKELSDFVSNSKITTIHNGVSNEKSIQDIVNNGSTNFKQVNTPESYKANFSDPIIKAKKINNLSIALSELGVEEKDVVKISLKISTGPLPDFQFNIVSDVSGSNSEGTKPVTLEQFLQVANKGDFDLSSIVSNESRYDKAASKAYLIVDENGNLIGNYPVNIDQDDFIYVVIVGEKTKMAGLTVDFTGTYNPVDLQMRSFTAIDPDFGASTYLPENLDFVVFKRGPFTSENVIVKINKKNGSSKEVISTYTMNVNKLFHLGFGVSFNRTKLENPDFQLSPLNGTANTIIQINEGNRNIISFNTIWYWASTINFLRRGSHITRGRDVLKEPSFGERINPTFGVSLDSKITDNMFVGLTFEFARGGSIVVGQHFGKVKRLAIPGFIPGTSTFSGTSNDILTTTESRDDWFLGLVLDTRIFNSLFKKGQ